MSLPELDIVIVNWNAGPQLAECLESIPCALNEGFCLNRVVVVDNASSDGSLDSIKRTAVPLTIIRNETNRGFAAACNQGAAPATGDYLLFLNPDTRLFEDSLLAPLQFMQRPENARVGLCGIQLVDEAGLVSRSCSRFPSAASIAAQALGLSRFGRLRSWGSRMDEWDHCETRMVDQLIGAFFIVRAELFRALNGFDERFFVYFEEVDFSYRALMAGYKSVYLSDARAFHAGGGVSRQVRAARLFYLLRSRLLYGLKHFSCAGNAAAMLVTLLIEPVSRIFFSFLRACPGDAYKTVKAHAMLLRALPRIIKTGCALQ
jgi:GT2 family glycosyltransferase